MSPFQWGIIVGLFLGTFVGGIFGVLAIALLESASKGDDRE